MVNLEQADLVYSVIVLQHNPPPVIHMLVRAFLKALNPGGVAYFQVPTYRVGYRFSPGEYLENEGKTHAMMEMHVIPHIIFQTACEESWSWSKSSKTTGPGFGWGRCRTPS